MQWHVDLQSAGVELVPQGYNETFPLAATTHRTLPKNLCGFCATDEDINVWLVFDLTASMVVHL